MADSVAGARDSVSAPTSAGDGWLLVGDAAGLVDPITREGIYFALLSGDVGRRRAILARPGDAASVYERSVREMRREIARAARSRRGFFRPRFTRLTARGARGTARASAR